MSRPTIDPGVLHHTTPLTRDDGRVDCSVCGGLLVVVEGGHEHADDPATTAAIERTDRQLIGAHELAAAKLIVQYGTLDPELLVVLGADAQNVGAARAIASFGTYSAERLRMVAEGHVPRQVYGPTPELAVFEQALAGIERAA